MEPRGAASRAIPQLGGWGGEMKEISDTSFRSLICGEPLRFWGPGYLEEMSVPGLYNPAASPAEPGLHWVHCGGAREVVAEKAQTLSGFPGLLREEAEGQAGPSQALATARREIGSLGSADLPGGGSVSGSLLPGRSSLLRLA